MTENYAYDSGDKLLGISVGGTTTRSYTYDGNGNPTAITTSAGTTSLAYNYDDKVTSLTKPNGVQNGYGYNGFGARVWKNQFGGFATATYHRAGPDVTDRLLSDGSATYNPGISVKSGGTTKIQHADRLGTNKLHTDSSGTTVGTQDYDAFGNLTSQTGVKNTLGFAGDFGYQEDAESGLKQLGHRLYDPSAGRFLTRDPIGAGANWYAYCDNNPTRRVDSSGLDWLLFDGEYLYLYDDSNKLIAQTRACSGVPGQTKADSCLVNGPIPEGDYEIDVDEIKSNTNNTLTSRILYPSAYHMDNDPWGDMMVPIHGGPDPSRKGMYVHGGKYYGSHGCIDIGHNEKAMLTLIRDRYKAKKSKSKKVKLRVKYKNKSVTAPGKFGDPHSKEWPPASSITPPVTVGGSSRHRANRAASQESERSTPGYHESELLLNLLRAQFFLCSA